MARYRRNRAGELVMGKDEERQIPSGPIRVDFDAMMPGYRTRHDGWNQQRLQRFFDVLAFSGCIEDACRVCGMSDVSARRMKKKYPLFASAWEDALARAQQGLIAIAYQRAVEGRETVIIRKGEEYQRKIEPSDAMLGLLIKRGDMSGGKLGEKSEDVLTFEEYQAGWRFTGFGKKYKQEDPAVVRARLDAKFASMRKRMFTDADRKGVCIRCEAPLRPGVTNQMLHDGEG